MTERRFLGRMVALACLWLLCLAGATGAWAGCDIKASGPSTLVVGTSDSIMTLLEPESSDAFADDVSGLSVRFEILSGSADFAGSASPVTLSVPFTSPLPSLFTSSLNITPRAAGDIKVRVTWLQNSVTGGQTELQCFGELVAVNGAEVLITALAASVDARLSAVSGGGQSYREGTDSAPLIVEVKSADGTPLANKMVSFSSIPAGRLGLSASSASTDASGRAQIRARGLNAGVAQVLATLVEVPAQTATFNLVVLPRLAGAQLRAVTSGVQSIALNTFSSPLVVEAKDGDGALLAGARIVWRTEPATAGVFECTTDCPTDSGGRGQNRVKASQAGNFSVVAAFADAPDVQARFLVQAGGIPSGSVLTIISGNNQQLVPGAPSAPLVVELKTAAGAPLPGVAIRFTATPANAVNFNPAVAMTDPGGRASTFAAPQLPGGAVISANVVSDPNISVSFNLTGGTMFIPGLNGNQQQVASAIDVACPRLSGMSGPGPGPGLGDGATDLLARCSEIVGAANGRPQDVQAVLNQLLPDEAAPQATASLNVRDSQLRNLDLRLDTVRAGGGRGLNLSGLTLNGGNGALSLDLVGDLLRTLAGDDEDDTAGGLISPWGMFVSGSLGRVDRDNTLNNPGFDSNNASITAGIDYRFNYHLVAGAAFGYDENDIDLVNDTGSIDTRSVTFSIYSSYATDNDFYLDGRLSYGELDFDLERRIRYNLGAAPVDIAAVATPDGTSRLGALSFGKNFSVNAWTFGGYLRGEWAKIKLDGYTEEIRNPTGNGRGLGVEIDERELKSRTGTLGARMGYSSSRSWGVLLPYARLEWVREFEDQAQTVVSRFSNDPSRTSIVIQSDDVDDGYGNVALGFSSVFANGKSAFLQYERRFAQEAIDRSTLTVGGRFEF